MPGSQYSQELRQYIGEVEVIASQCTDAFARHMCFLDAIRDLPDSFSPEERGLATRLFQTRARETQPANIGGASGEAGEAD